MAKARKPWTKDSLLRHLRRLLSSKEVHLQFTPLETETAKVNWDSTDPPQNIQIKVDPDKDGRIRSTIHELLHVVLNTTLHPVFDDELEEEAILGWEEVLYNHAKSSSRRLAGWRRAIDRKLATQEEVEE